jgi:SAM-dependent methyltransferase
MKIRESGMPEEQVWSRLFDIEHILAKLQINKEIEYVAEVGCGYGTFTIPASQLISSKLYAFDIDENMVDAVRQKSEDSGIDNIIPEQRDVLKEGTGLPENSMDYVMLFNILHHEDPHELLMETHRILKPTGKVGIIHWRSDIPTPRGPALNIRPKPQDIVQLIDDQFFTLEKAPFILEPYHYGMVLTKQ